MSKDKEAKKDGQLIIRIKKKEREAFIQACEAQDSTAAREIRRFIKDFLDDRREAKAED